MNDTPRFGTAGLADSYTVKKFDPAAIAAYTAGFGLTAFEYQCGRGVRLAHDKAAALGAAPEQLLAGIGHVGAGGVAEGLAAAAVALSQHIAQHRVK